MVSFAAHDHLRYSIINFRPNLRDSPDFRTGVYNCMNAGAPFLRDCRCRFLQARFDSALLSTSGGQFVPQSRSFRIRSRTLQHRPLCLHALSDM